MMIWHKAQRYTYVNVLSIRTKLQTNIYIFHSIINLVRNEMVDSINVGNL